MTLKSFLLTQINFAENSLKDRIIPNMAENVGDKQETVVEVVVSSKSNSQPLVDSHCCREKDNYQNSVNIAS